MKKTVSQIYRLAFILFYIWATFESIFLSGGGIRNAFSAPALLADTCAFLVVLASFIFSVIGSIPEVLIRIKGAVTAMAFLVLVLAFSMFFTPSAPGWILNILLPVMMILDCPILGSIPEDEGYMADLVTGKGLRIFAHWMSNPVQGILHQLLNC